ncbi:MAG: N-(5'-phosphoribosyl)anthranilate isomerase [Candidatus Amulumruptor caecigallinarius]|nr:MAG: N-(5'-phosphoribosyl)anthranilate isomerase [Candidatus Amulumruptor caecigallinarius]
MRDKKLKICGMRDADNIREIAALSPDYMGFIFYDKSPRSAIGMPQSNLSLLSSATRPVGVFVNESAETIHAICNAYGIDTVQLHGAETPLFCRELQSRGLHVWKAFGLDDGFDFSLLTPYKDTVEMFVFDTKTSAHGGSGQRFDWKILDRYTLDVPYLLSGGIGPEASDEVLRSFSRPHLAGIDLNSRFESSPGFKDSEKLTNFVITLTK